MGNSIMVRCLLITVVILACTITHSYGSMAGLKNKIERTTELNPTSNDLDSKLAHMLESTEVIHGLQAQVSSVTRSLDTFLNDHAADENAQHLDHEQIGQILSTLSRLTASQKEIEERNARQIEQDHANLLELIATQKKQQEMLTKELEHSKNLELQLAQLRQEQEQQANQHMAAQELASSQNLEHDLAHQQADLMMDDAANDGSFLETTSTSHVTSHPDLPHHEDAPWPHEHDVDLAHTIDWNSESALEVQESELGQQAAAASLPDPSRYSSSADYLAAMNSADEAEDMTPEQMEELGQHTLGEHEVGTPHSPSGIHSMSEIDALVNEGESEHHESEFEFHPSMLHNPKLAEELSSLQDEDSINKAMLKAQAKIRAIAAELEKHQSANGGDHSEGLEIDMVDIGSDGHF